MTRRLRILSQTLFFTLFLALLTQTQYQGRDELGLPVKLWLEIDPLHFLSTLLASGSVPGLLWLSLITLALTLVLGRFFCGWICPMGVMIQLAQKLPLRRRPDVIRTNRWRRSQTIKFYLLAGLLAAALFGAQWSGLFDPISIAVRSLGLVVLPGAEMGLRGLFDTAYHFNPLGVSRFSEPVFGWLQGRVIHFAQPRFHQAFLLGTILAAILAASFVRHRFWCRVLCPLGALLGTFARFGLFRIRQRDGCKDCHLCTFHCQGAAEPEIRGGWRPSECLVCGNCTAACGQHGLAMGFARPRALLPPAAGGPAPAPRALRAQAPGGPAPLPRTAESPAPAAAAPSPAKPASPVPAWSSAFAGAQVRRRHLLLAAAAGVAGVPMLRLPLSPARADPALIRPPGALPEREFLERCVRCGECMKVCLTNGLQPTLLEAGLEGIWTPRLVPRIGYCEFHCTLCGQVCPTQAIRRLEPEEKKRVRIGLAAIDASRCLPFAFQTSCIVCEEHCPLPKKAIWFREAAVVTAAGETRVVKQPQVDIELCTGCGICETKCVVQDLPAIRVTSANEDRNPHNRVLLEEAAP
ncbi:MAG: 4Fe-4S binding protein [Candidatus Eisenbacteria bacterium]|uniref:4Fe-4S binding protein n=1 Tax=Eiseniibacteriota bacterium TaxID=2212470 RepID=A0A937XB36_UNCEI|nr:4Fe-4S binding protein [Candidatus Eisenbacteria bacterium]